MYSNVVVYRYTILLSPCVIALINKFHWLDRMARYLVKMCFILYLFLDFKINIFIYLITQSNDH